MVPSSSSSSSISLLLFLFLAVVSQQRREEGRCSCVSASVMIGLPTNRRRINDLLYNHLNSPILFDHPERRTLHSRRRRRHAHNYGGDRRRRHSSWMAFTASTLAPEQDLMFQTNGTLAPAPPSPLVRVVAGTVELVLTAVVEYVSGFPLGFSAGILVLPVARFLPQAASSWHARARHWGHSWGKFNAIMSSFGVLIPMVRGTSSSGPDDPWNAIFHSMMTGAYFARREGPQSMLKSALLYGGTVYLISNYGSAGRKDKPSKLAFSDQTLEGF